MAATASPPASTEWVPALDVDGPADQSRVTVFFRALLLIPHAIVLFFLAIAAYVVAVVGWFAALVLGRLPDWAADFLTGYVAWTTRVSASFYLLVGPYPPFAMRAPEYVARIEVRPGPLNRLAVLFRFILVIPAAIVSTVLTTGWQFAALVIWLIVLVKGRMPQPLFEATAAVLRYSMRLQAYMMLLTSAYPKNVFGDDKTAVEGRASATRPLVLGGTARNLMILFIVLGVLGVIGQSLSQASMR